MAGPLDALMSVFRTAPMVAQSRITRTPIYRSDLPDLAAEFHAPNALMTLMRGAVGMPPSPGYIMANEAKGGLDSDTIRHESIHAAMQPTARDLLLSGLGTSRAAQALGPQAQALASTIPAVSLRGGIDAVPQETLAYVGANPDVANIQPAQRTAALNEILANMPKVYPAATSALYRRLITK